MVEFIFALLGALALSFGYIFYQAIMLKRLSEELKQHQPPF